MGMALEKQEINSRQRVYNFLVNFITDNGYATPVREIAEGTDLKSTSSVHEQLLMLERLGKINVEKGKTRAIRLEGYKFVKVT